jgi:hypothetical protein
VGLQVNRTLLNKNDFQKFFYQKPRHLSIGISGRRLNVGTSWKDGAFTDAEPE